MRQKILLTLALFASFLFPACGGGQTNATNAPATVSPSATPTVVMTTPTPAAQQQIVTATVEEAKLDAGGAGEATVKLDITEGYHVNANPASDKFLVATELRAEQQEGITPGKPVYPPASKRKFQFSEKPLAVYEGQPIVKLPLRADATTTKGRHTLRATLRVQPCNERECFQPRNVEVAIPVTVN